MPEASQLTRELTVLDPREVRLYIDSFEDLRLELNGQPGRRVRAGRCYPITEPTRWITLRDHEGEEIGLIVDADQLDEPSRRALQAELERTYVLPKIEHIHDILDHHGVPAWEVETDRGPRTVEIRSSRRDIRLLSDGQVLIRDADGNYFEIPDSRQLDPASRALLESQI
jgi:hypothetical protein